MNNQTTDFITEAIEETTSATDIVNNENIEAEETVEIVGVETFPPENGQVDNMIYTLPMMGKGMLGIFLVTVIIIASVAILNKVTGKK